MCNLTRIIFWRLCLTLKMIKGNVLRSWSQLFRIIGSFNLAIRTYTVYCNCSTVLFVSIIMQIEGLTISFYNVMGNLFHFWQLQTVTYLPDSRSLSNIEIFAASSWCSEWFYSELDYYWLACNYFQLCLGEILKKKQSS